MKTRYIVRLIIWGLLLVACFVLGALGIAKNRSLINLSYNESVEII